MAALAGAREASRKAMEQAMQLRARTMLVEEAASMAREEAIYYNDAAADLEKENASSRLTLPLSEMPSKR